VDEGSSEFLLCYVDCVVSASALFVMVQIASLYYIVLYSVDPIFCFQLQFITHFKFCSGLRSAGPVVRGGDPRHGRAER
jgi:hypothetical protein